MGPLWPEKGPCGHKTGSYSHKRASVATKVAQTATKKALSSQKGWAPESPRGPPASKKCGGEPSPHKLRPCWSTFQGPLVPFPSVQGPLILFRGQFLTVRFALIRFNFHFHWDSIIRIKNVSPMHRIIGSSDFKSDSPTTGPLSPSNCWCFFLFIVHRFHRCRNVPKSGGVKAVKVGGPPIGIMLKKVKSGRPWPP